MSEISGALPSDEARTPGAAGSERRALVAVGVSTVAVVALWATPLLLPLRLAVTLVHEAGHALAAESVGGDVVAVTVNRHGGGLTTSIGPGGTFRRIAISSAGYLGATAAGALMLSALPRLRTARVALGALAAAVAVMAVLWVPLRDIEVDAVSAAATGSQAGDGRFTLLLCFGLVAVLVAVAAQPSVMARRLFVAVVAVGLCLGAVKDLWLLVGSSAAGRHSDARILAEATWIPAILWALLWLALGGAVVAVSALRLWRSARGGDGSGGGASQTLRPPLGPA